LRADAVEREELETRCRVLQRLQLEDIHIAGPLHTLKPPDLGYVTHLMTEMTPFSALLNMPTDEPNFIAWYLRTGGLGRRLRMLAGAADIIGTLHSRGWIYGDVSPGNIFISSDPEYDEVWLIDADNITWDPHPTPLMSPGYGAPELVRETAGPSWRTDAYAFAVLVFWSLSGLHPFDGDLVHNEDEDFRERAYAGEVPWVDHSTDKSNEAEGRGIPRRFVFSDGMKELAAETFEHSIAAPDRRPSVQAWASTLHRAADMVLQCTTCPGSYFARDKCPWCGKPRPPFVMMSTKHWRPRTLAQAGLAMIPGADPMVDHIALAYGRSATITRRTSDGCSGIAGQRPVAVLTPTERGIEVRPEEDAELAAASADGATWRPLASGTRSVIPYEWSLHLGPSDAEHIAPSDANPALRGLVHRAAFFRKFAAQVQA
jgi:hypothetical protein